MSTLKRKAPAAKTAAAAPAAESAAAAAPPASSGEDGGKKKRKTDSKSKGASAAAKQKQAPEPEPEEQMDDMEMLVSLESSIVGDGSSDSADESVAAHYNSLVKMVHLAEKAPTAKGADEIAVAVSAVQAVVRIFTQWMATGQFLNSKSAAKKEKSAVMRTLEGLLATQYKKLWSVLYALLQSSNEAVQSNALHAAMDLVQAEGSSIAAAAPVPASTVPETLGSGSSFATLLRCILLSGADKSTHAALRAELRDTFLRPHTDLRLAALREVKTIVHLPESEFKEAVKLWAVKSAAKSSSSSGSSALSAIVDLMLSMDWQSVPTKNWIVLPESDPDSDEALFAMPAASNLSTAAFNKLLSEAWLGLLRGRLSLDDYKSILVVIHSDIIPIVSAPLALADFLTDSYNLGGIISLLSLNALFILISKYNLDYPDFFAKLYRTCRPYVFHAKYRARFFQLVALFLTSSYLPSYLVCAFAKRFARLSLTAPPSGAIFCTAVIYNLLRRHPVVRPLINRLLKDAPASTKAQLLVVAAAEEKITIDAATGVAVVPEAAPKVNGGILSSLSSLLRERTDAVSTGTLASSLDDLDDSEDGVLRLSLPVYKAPPASHSLQKGNDPYRDEEEDPEQSRASESSLWEIKTLCDHFSPTVSNLAKVFFSSHAPKKDLELTKYIAQSYETLFEKESGRRANQKVALQNQRKFGGIFEDAQASIGLTFALPSAAAPAAVAATSAMQEE